MSQVTEQSVRFQTALASIKLIQASAVLDLTEDDFDFLTSNKVWIATDRSRARRCVEACVYGTLDFVGYPRFPAPVEFIAAVIAYYVHPVNIQTACLIMEGAEFTENIINGVERPVKAAELFAFTLRVRAGNTDVLTDAEENVRQKLRAEGVDRKSGSAGMPRPISYAVFCLKKKSHFVLKQLVRNTVLPAQSLGVQRVQARKRCSLTRVLAFERGERQVWQKVVVTGDSANRGLDRIAPERRVEVFVQQDFELCCGFRCGVLGLGAHAVDYSADDDGSTEDNRRRAIGRL